MWLADLGNQLTDAAGSASRFESGAALVGAALVILAFLVGGAIAAERIIRAIRTPRVEDEVRKTGESIKDAIRSEAVKINGVPLKMLDSAPIPMWFKDRDSIMRWVNFAYAQMFSIRPEDYINKHDAQVWPAAVAKQFVENDLWAIRDRIRIETWEWVPDRAGTSDPDPTGRWWWVVKWCVIDPVTDEVRGTAGFCLPNEFIDRASDADRKQVIAMPVGSRLHEVPIEEGRIKRREPESITPADEEASTDVL